MVDVYTGTYEWLRYPDKDGVEQPIFLYIEDGKRWIPAPKYYWKVIHNKATNEAVAFVGVNDPHTPERPEWLCRQDACPGLSWVDWDVDSQGNYST